MEGISSAQPLNIANNNGLIYSLKGTAVINASDFTMSGSIVANSILIKGKRINIKNP